MPKGFWIFFHKTDPINPNAIDDMYNYLSKTLQDLQVQIQIFKPKVLIGSSGTFDTLCEIYIQEFRIDHDLYSATEFEIPINYFGEVFYKLITKNVSDRKLIPGMSNMRVDMIVVAVCLIDYVLKKFYINRLRVSFYSLKEGVLYLMANSESVDMEDSDIKVNI